MHAKTIGTTLALLCAALSPLRASADAAAEARFHDEAARAHYEAGRFDAAVREFMIEQRIAPNPNTVLNIAFCFQQMDRNDEAYMYFLEYLDTGEDEERRQRAEAALEDLRSEVAIVRIESEPEGAGIYVDRAELGQYGVTPRVLALPPGEHRLWVEKSGYRPAEQTVSLEAGRETTLRLEPERILGRLRLTATAEADVRIVDADGELVWEGTTPVDTQLPIGNYQAFARSGGGDRWTEPLSIEEEGVTEAHAELRGPMGEVSVVANQAGATVLLDGTEWGFTPQILTEVPVGEHRLEVTLEGQRPYEGEVEVTEEGRAWVEVSLSPTPTGPFTPDTLIAGGVSLALLGVAGLFTGLAATADTEFQDAQSMGDPYLQSLDDANRFAIGADLLWLTGGAAAVATLILAIVHSIDTSGPSTATVTRRDR